MSKEKSDHLFLLIHSMNRSEKRYFKLLHKKSEQDETKFLRLFDLLEAQEQQDEEALLRAEPSLNPAQLSNLKAHLYKRLLQAIRQFHAGKLHAVEIREMIDFAEVLFSRGLYEQCSDMLQKAKKRALRHDHLELLLEIYRWEKNILTQTIHRDNELRVQKIVQGVQDATTRIANINLFSNLSAALNALYMRIGLAKNAQDHERARQLIEERLSHIRPEELSWSEQASLYELYTEYYFFTQDIDKAKCYASRWLQLFELQPQRIGSQLDKYIKSINSLLNALYKLGHYPEFVQAQLKLKAIYQLPVQLNENIRTKLFKYTYVHEFNRLFMVGDFSTGVHRFNKLQRYLELYIEKLDKHSRLVLYYKIACLYFGDEQHREALYWLNRIINNSEEMQHDLREDIGGFARIVALIAHFELGNTDILEYQIRSTYRYLLKGGTLYALQRYILRFLRQLDKHDTPMAVRLKFVALREQLLPLQQDPYEKRPFSYFDIISWLDSKIEHRPVQDVIREKAGIGVLS